MEIDVARTTCSFCPKLCRHECPVAIAEKTEVATPTFKQQVAKLAAAGTLPLDAAAARAFYKCTGCLASRTPCRYEVEVEPSLRDARGLAVRRGVAPPEVAKVRDRFRAHGSPFSRDLASVLAGLLPGSVGPEKPATVIFPACTSLAHFPEDVAEARAALTATSAEKEGIPVVLPSPPCCGYPLDALGLADDFASHARRVRSSLAGYRRIVATGPACAWTLASRYREVGAPIDGEVVTVEEELAARADRIAALRGSSRPGGGPFAYHDACYLGRHLGKYDEPRAAVAAATGEAPLELDRARESAYCSGGGAGYPLTHPESAREVARRALLAYRKTGARTLVTACPTARRLFARTDPELAVTSVVSVVARAIERA